MDKMVSLEEEAETDSEILLSLCDCLLNEAVDKELCPPNSPYTTRVPPFPGSHQKDDDDAQF